MSSSFYALVLYSASPSSTSPFHQQVDSFPLKGQTRKKEKLNIQFFPPLLKLAFMISFLKEDEKQTKVTRGVLWGCGLVKAQPVVPSEAAWCLIEGETVFNQALCGTRLSFPFTKYLFTFFKLERRRTFSFLFYQRRNFQTQTKRITQ